MVSAQTEGDTGYDYNDAYVDEYNDESGQTCSQLCHQFADARRLLAIGGKEDSRQTDIMF